MSEPIPEDVMQRAKALLLDELYDCVSIDYRTYHECISWENADAVAIIARALMEERRAERERCAKLVEQDALDASIRLDPTKHKNLSDWFAERRAAAIRGQP